MEEEIIVQEETTVPEETAADYTEILESILQVHSDNQTILLYLLALVTALIGITLISIFFQGKGGSSK